MDKCDLIMKGGITSGVVYPKAVTELSKKYKFGNIGGTSAGAIAAGFTAAAEYNRSVSGRNTDGFDILDQIPDQLSVDLLGLFEPTKEHQKAFKFLMKVKEKKGAGLFFSLVWHVRLIKKTLKSLPKSFYGICTGISHDKDENLALTDWMNLWLEKTAGRIGNNDELPTEPLTFKILQDEGIKLRTITTNLSQRTPINLPNLGFSLVKKNDLKRLLPENLVRYIENNQYDSETLNKIENKDDFLVLPTGGDMPVLLAMRLSLSFPILLSAFPIYRIDYSLHLCAEEQKKPKLCWLSDGGITSNFPIHLFDSYFPSRPTFGVLLDEFNDCRHKSDDSNDLKFPINRIYLPTKSGQGLTVRVHEIDNVFKFLMSIFNAAQTWQDSNQTYLSGYRERIVRISLKEDEGGMNLDMPSEVIESLTSLGEHAGEVLRDQFNFDEHRWRRVLNAYSALELALDDIESQYSNSDPETIPDFLLRCQQSIEANEPIIKSYVPQTEEIKELRERLDKLVDVARDWKQEPLRDRWGGGKMPKPSPALKLTPESYLD